MSPIFLKEFHCTESETNLTINIKLVSGIIERNLDIFISEAYIKINSPPFFWEAFLSDEILTERNHQIIKVKAGVEVTLTLTKKNKGLWIKLFKEIPDKSTMILMRQAAIKRHHQISLDHDAEAEQRKLQIKTTLMEQQMKLEEDERKNIKFQNEVDKLDALRSMFQVTEPKEEKKPKVPVPDSRLIPAPRKKTTIFVNFTPKN